MLLGYFHTGVLGVFPGGLVWGYITGVQLGDYWDTSWETTEGTLLNSRSMTLKPLELGHEPLLGDYCRGDK